MHRERGYHRVEGLNKSMNHSVGGQWVETVIQGFERVRGKARQGFGSQRRILMSILFEIGNHWNGEMVGSRRVIHSNRTLNCCHI